MSRQNPLTRSAAYWALVAVSVLLAAGGAALSLPRIAGMEEALTAGTATGVEVYVGQAWITVAAGLLGAGAIGILAALALAAASALVARRTIDPVDDCAEGGSATDVVPRDEADAVAPAVDARAAHADADEPDAGRHDAEGGLDDLRVATREGAVVDSPADAEAPDARPAKR